jgi:hypothetical protein
MQSKILEVFYQDFVWGWGFALALLSHMCVLGSGQKKVCVECNGYGSKGGSRSGHDNDHQ